MCGSRANNTDERQQGIQKSLLSRCIGDSGSRELEGARAAEKKPNTRWVHNPRSKPTMASGCGLLRG